MSRKIKTLIGLTIATTLILLIKIVSSIAWIRNHILQMHDECDELRRISNDIYTQGLRIDDPNFSDIGDCDD
jgi:hypothetical protein